MLLVHQTASVKVGEVVRYTLTYTPAADRILPSPSFLHLKIKNTSAIPFRAAYLHGPYTLHVSAYPSTFNPNQKLESPRQFGVPEFEPNLKAGGHWTSKLTVPEDIRESGDKANSRRNLDGSPKTATWIIEIASQILFSNTASVGFELLVGRDQRSLELGFAAVAGKGHGEPGQIQDFKHREEHTPQRRTQPKGIYSTAVALVVEDTETLWDKPALPQWDDGSGRLSTDGRSNAHTRKTNQEQSKGPKGSRNPEKRSDGPIRTRKQKKLHLVVLTHGLHSNVSADMLYLKESIDAAARNAREEAKEKKRRKRGRDQSSARASSSRPGKSTAKRRKDSQANATAPISGGQDQIRDDEDQETEEDSDDEEVIVRGFSGNAVRTERGIQYLGKRLAKFVLTTTYPDQPFLPTTKSITKTLTGSFSNASTKSSKYGTPAHAGSSISRPASEVDKLPYTFTSISFVGHSLGGLVQTYAIAYIHKHSPNFFQKIKPINFVALATPFLGLSNENPLYVKFALDFGLVGRTGQDLGLTWRAPTIARNRWSAMIAGLGSSKDTQEQAKQQDPRSKPLLRILPSGPAHQVLKMFRNRTLYSNVVNDGIVPLRTSCLLFLDWHGLGKVDNARREYGLIGTMAAFGWAEITGSNSTAYRQALAKAEDENGSMLSGDDEPVSPGAPRKGVDVPQPFSNALENDEEAQAQAQASLPRQSLSHQLREGRSGNPNGFTEDNSDANEMNAKSYTLPHNPLSDFLSYFRPGPGKAYEAPPKMSNKVTKAYRRAQTLQHGLSATNADSETDPSTTSQHSERPTARRGDSVVDDPNTMPPPKTSIFDAAGDILNPPLPPQSWLIDPSTRDRTIFHDRVYHPDDIPPPAAKRPRLSRSLSSSGSGSTQSGDGSGDAGGMKVEEKIARAYHSGMSWRKVLVRLEPDAHNNMIVRRMFANAYGWDVVKHLCDTHFADTFAMKTADGEESRVDRAKPPEVSVTETGEEVDGQTDSGPSRSDFYKTTSESREELDQVADLKTPVHRTGRLTSSTISSMPRLKSWTSEDSVAWTDSVFDDGDDAEDSEDEALGPMQAFQRLWSGSPKSRARSDNQLDTDGLRNRTDEDGTSKADNAEFLVQSPQAVETQDAHRGLGVVKRSQPPQQASDADAVEPLTPVRSKPGDLPNLVTPVSPHGTTDVGLKKPPEAHLADATASPELTRERASSISEQVAGLSLGSKGAS